MRRLLALLHQGFTREHAVCLSALFVCALLSAGPAVLQNAAPVAFPEILSIPEIGQGLITDPLKTSHYRAARSIESYSYMHEITRGRGSILWDPNEYAGTPFLAAWDSRVFSPFSLPFYIFDIRVAVHIAAVLKVFTAGVLAYYVARVLGLTQPFALFVGVVHALSAPITVWTIDPASDTAVWVPLLFLFAERMSLAQHRYWPAGALVIGAMLFSGAPQAVASSFVFFAAYFQLRRRVETVREFVVPVASALASIVLGLCLAAAQIWPYFEWLRESTPVWIPAEEGAGANSLWVLFGPLAGRVGFDPALAPLHLGLIPLALAVLWFMVRPGVTEGQRRRVDALLIVSGIWLAAALVISSIQPLLPALQVVLMRQLLAPVAFSVALAAAASGEAWLQLRPADSLAAAKRYLLLLGGLFFLVALSYFIAAVRAPMSDALRQDVTIAALTMCLYVLVLGATLVRPWPRLMGYALTLATAAQLALFFAPVQPRTPWSRVFADPFDGAGERVEGRVAFGPRTESAGRIALTSPTIQGFGSRAPARTAAYLVRAQEDPMLLPRANVSAFVLALADMRGPFSNLRPQMQLAGVSEWGVGLFAYVPGARPARMIYEARVVPRFNPAKLSSADPPLIEHNVALPAPQGQPGKPIVSDDGRPTFRTVNVYRTDPGILELAESYYPDWFARIDKSFVRVFPVDGAFRGVEIPAGSREVVFRYAPQSYRWGRVISFAALAICLGGLAHLIYFRIRHQFFNM